MKKIWTAFLIILSLTAAAPAAAYADSPKLNVKVSVSKGKINVGDTVEVTVELQNYSDQSIQSIGGIQLDIPIDAEYLEYVNGSEKALLKTEAGDFLSAAYNQSKSQFTFMYMYMNAGEKALNRENTGVLSLQLKLIKAIPETKTLEITCKAAIANTDSQPIPVDVIVAQISSNETNSTQSGDLTSTDDQTDHVPIDPDGKLPWDDVVINNPNGKEITTEKTKEGLLIRGDDLSDLIAVVKKGNQEASVEIKTDQTEVLIKENENGNIEAYIDTDGDGVFETPISKADFKQKDDTALIWALSIGIPGLIIVVAGILIIRKRKI